MNELNDNSLCECGHTLEDHHRWWMRGGGAFADECEFYGSNESGGWMPNPDTENGLPWVKHCQRFTLTKDIINE